jgi:hypothetical protein
MAEKIELEVIVRPDGKVVLKTHGLKGETCLQETKDVEAALGKVARREKTREAFEKAAAASASIKRK